MKIAEVTAITPWKENRGGTSALQYHLLIERPKDVSVEIWTYNLNGLTNDEIRLVEEELNVKIHLVKRPWWVENQSNLRLLRGILKYPMLSYLKLSKQVIQDIETRKPDGVWIYQEELFRVSKQLNKCKRVHTFPDAESLYYERMGGWKKLVVGGKYRAMECAMDRNTKYHLVGEEDVKWFKSVAHDVEAYFIRHPHYELVGKKIGFGEKIQLLVAGRNDIYMRGRADEMVDVLESLKLVDGYAITFLGKGWNDEVERLKQVGYEVNWKEYVENYVAEVVKYDVQISPISLGTGTKGKVLDAMANGVLVVGTEYALENIIEGGVLYRSKEELKEILLDVLNNRTKYEKMAEDARVNVRREHDRSLVCKQMIELFG